MTDPGGEVRERELEEDFIQASQSGALVVRAAGYGAGGGGGGKVREKRHRGRPGPYTRPAPSTRLLTNGTSGGSGGGGGGGGGGGVVRELARSGTDNWLGGWKLPLPLSLKGVVGWAWGGKAKEEEEQKEEENGVRGQELLEGPSHGTGDSRGGFIPQVSYEAGGTSDIRTRGGGREKNETFFLDTQGDDAKDLQNVDLYAIANGKQSLNSKQLDAVKKLINSLDSTKGSEENIVINSGAGGSVKAIGYHTPNRFIADREREIISHGTRRTGLFTPPREGGFEEEEVFHTPPASSSPRKEEVAGQVHKTPEILVAEFMRNHPRPGSPRLVPNLTMERWKAPISNPSVNESLRETWETTSVHRRAMETLEAPLFKDVSVDHYRRALVSRDSRFDTHASLSPSRTFQRVDGIQQGQALSGWQTSKQLGQKRRFHATEETWNSVTPMQKTRRTLSGCLPMTGNRYSLQGHTTIGDHAGPSRRTEHREVSSSFQRNLGAPTLTPAPTPTASSLKAQQILASLDRTFRPGETAVDTRLASRVIPAEKLEQRFTRSTTATRTTDLLPPPLGSQLSAPVKKSSSVSLPPSTPTQYQAASQAMDKARGGNGTLTTIGNTMTMGNSTVIGKRKESEKFPGALSDGWKGEAPAMENKTPLFNQGQSSLTTGGGEAGQSSGGKGGFRMSVDDEDMEKNAGRATSAGPKDFSSQPSVSSHIEAKKSIPQPTSSFNFGPVTDRGVLEEKTKDPVAPVFSFPGAQKTEVPQTPKLSRKGSDSVTSDSQEKGSVGNPIFQFGATENGEEKGNSLNFGASTAAQGPVTREEPKFSFQSTKGTTSLSGKSVTEQPSAVTLPPLQKLPENSSPPSQAPGGGGGQPFNLPEEKSNGGNFGNNGSLSAVGELKASGFGLHGPPSQGGDKSGSTPGGSFFAFGKPPESSGNLFGNAPESTGNLFGKINTSGGDAPFTISGGKQNNAKTEQLPTETANSTPPPPSPSPLFAFSSQPSSGFMKSSALLFGGTGFSTASSAQTSPSPSPSTFTSSSTQFLKAEAVDNGISGPKQSMNNGTQALTTPTTPTSPLTSPSPVSGPLFSLPSPSLSAPSAFTFGSSSVKSDTGGFSSLSTPPTTSTPAPIPAPTPTPTPTLTSTPISVPLFGQSSEGPLSSPKTESLFQGTPFGAPKSSGTDQTSSSLPSPSPSSPVFGTTKPAFGSGPFGQSSTPNFGSSPSSSSFPRFGGASTSSPSSTSAPVFGASTLSGSSAPLVFGSIPSSPSPPTFGTSTISAVSGSSPSPPPAFSFTAQSGKAPSQFVFGTSVPSPSLSPSPSPLPPPSSVPLFGTSLSSTPSATFGFSSPQNSMFGQQGMSFGQGGGGGRGPNGPNSGDGGGSPNPMEDSMGVEPFSPPKVVPQNNNNMFGPSPSPSTPPGANGGAFTFGQPLPPQGSVVTFGASGPSQMSPFGAPQQPQSLQPFGALSPSPLPPSPSPVPAPALAFGGGVGPLFNMGGGGGEKAGASSRRIVKAKRNRK